MRIALLKGGWSVERPGSLRTSNMVATSLRRLGHEVQELDPSQDDLLAAVRQADLVFNGLHGRYGEDGKLQGLLDTLRIKHTGPGVLASAVGMHKPTFKRVITSDGIETPPWVQPMAGSAATQAREVMATLPFPVIVKPASAGGSYGIVVARSEQELANALEASSRDHGELLVEQFLPGDSITVGVLGSGREAKALGVLKVIIDKSVGDFYTESIKHTKGLATYEAPAKLAPGVYAAAEAIAARVSSILGCHGAVRVDMLVTPDDRLYVLEINTLPGLSEIGNLPTIASARGMSYDQLIATIVDHAIQKPQYLP